MTSQPQQDSEPGRKFDDIASLFGAIVPPPGSPVRPAVRLRPLPVALPEPTSPPVIPSPPEMPVPVAAPPEALEPEAPVVSEPVETTAPPSIALAPPPPLRVDPPALARPRPTEIPWPDAFEPRPNFKKSEPRNWSWLLLIPAGIVAALGISAVDTRALRGWVDTNVLHRSPTTGIDDSLLPAPFRSKAPTSQTPVGQADPGAAAPADTAQTDAADPYPALPTSPVPVPPGTVVSPPPVDTTPQAAAAAAVPIHVTIQYRRNIPGADGEARRIAALLQSTGGSVELRPGTASVKVPTITYYNAADKQAASALALVLANEAATWTLQLGTAKNPPGSLDIWMP